MQTASLHRLALAVVLVLATATVSASAFAEKGKHNQRVNESNDVGIDLGIGTHYGKGGFTNKEQRIVREYFRSESADLPPGLAKRKSLPPGLQKQLRKTGQLPPGLEKHRMPSDLEAKLPKYFGPYERAIVGNDLVMLDPKTGKILDVMPEIFDAMARKTSGKAGTRRVKY